MNQRPTNLTAYGTLRTFEENPDFVSRSVDSFCDVDLQIIAGEMAIRRSVKTLEDYMKRFVPTHLMAPFVNTGNLE